MAKAQRPSSPWIQLEIVLLVVLSLFLIWSSFIPEVNTLDEGFHLAWGYRLRSGQLPYRDFHAQHGPLYIVFFNLFFKALGLSLYSFRAYQAFSLVLGLWFFYLVIKLFSRHQWLRVTALTALASWGRFKLRQALPLLAVVLYQRYLGYKNKLFTGIILGLWLFFSVETSAIALASLFGWEVIVLVADKTSFKAAINRISRLVLGVVMGITPAVFWLIKHRQLEQFVFTAWIEFPQLVKLVSHLAFPLPYQLVNSHQPILVKMFVLMKNGLARWYLGLWLYPIILGVLVKFRSRILNQSWCTLGSLLIFASLLFITLFSRPDEAHLFTVLFPSLIFLVWLIENIPQFFSRSISYYSRLFLVIILIFQLRLIKVVGQISPLQNSSRLTRHQQIITAIKTYSQANQPIFIFSDEPYYYFSANRPNATSFDLPFLAASSRLTQQLLSELQSHPPQLIVSTSLAVDSLPNQIRLPQVWQWIKANYATIEVDNKLSMFVLNTN